MRLLRLNKSNMLPLSMGILVFILWQTKVIHALLRLEVYQLPIPSAIWSSILENHKTLGEFAKYTGTEAILGFLIGSLLGMLVAVSAVYVPKMAKGGLTVVAALNAVPIVALAPIMNNWFGDGMGSRIGVVAVLTMATMAINAYKGLSSIDPSYLELMHASAATKGQTFIKLRVMHALPHIFTALKINMATSISGSIVGEFFISSKGIGYLLSDQIKLSNMPLSWACIVYAAAGGILLYYVIELLERLFIPWHVSRH
ncbi:MAG: ABC transporter permease [Paenibacillus sp. RIFOXYA1_FULL_44_5]|nr:MAG: ABC transporter permease [Paenibacillus sp. RIFOXYA1_FULL_44_5]